MLSELLLATAGGDRVYAKGRFTAGGDVVAPAAAEAGIRPESEGSAAGASARPPPLSRLGGGEEGARGSTLPTVPRSSSGAVT